MDKARPDVPTTIETDVEPPKKKMKKSKEFEMLESVLEEIEDKKKAVEVYVNNTRNLLHSALQQFVTEQEREAFLTKLKETEDWLHGDGKDEKEDVYTAKLHELKKLIEKEKEVEVPVAKESWDMNKAPVDMPTTNEADVAPPKKIKKSIEFIDLERALEETKDKKKAVEVYVDHMWSLLHRKLKPYAKNPEGEAFLAKLKETKDWLHEKGKDEKEDVYSAKLDELMKEGEFIEVRNDKHIDESNALIRLVYAMDCFISPKYEHINLSEKMEVLRKREEVTKWLHDEVIQQDSFSEDLLSDIKMKTEEFERIGRSLLTQNPPTPSSSGSAQGGV